jgi:hypothetical protein
MTLRTRTFKGDQADYESLRARRIFRMEGTGHSSLRSLKGLPEALGK